MSTLAPCKNCGSNERLVTERKPYFNDPVFRVACKTMWTPQQVVSCSWGPLSYSREGAERGWNEGANRGKDAETRT